MMYDEKYQLLNILSIQPKSRLKYMYINYSKIIIDFTCQIKTRYQTYEILDGVGVNSVGYRLRDGT